MENTQIALLHWSSLNVACIDNKYFELPIHLAKLASCSTNTVATAIQTVEDVHEIDRDAISV